MALMDKSVWQGKAYSGGWSRRRRRRPPSSSPPPGGELGRIGIAAPPT